MSFEIKYNRDGEVVTPATSVVPVPEAPVIVQAVQEDVAPVDQPEEPIIEQEHTETAEQEQAHAQAEAAAKQQAVQENFRALRDKAERMEQERNEYMRMLEEEKARKAESADEDLNIGDDDLAEGKHLKKLQQEVKKLRQQSEQAKQQYSLNQMELKLRAQYPDFDKVVSAENITALRNQFPGRAASIHANPDVYLKAIDAYESIKNLGIHKEDIFIAEKAQTIKNAAKPKPLASISPQKADTPLSHANAFAQGLTKELQAQLIKEMNDSRRGY